MTLPTSLAESQATQPGIDPLPGIIHFGSINILAGSSGVGKTCLLAWLLTRFRDGLPLFGRPVNTPAKIGYISADRGGASARYWFVKAGYGTIPMYSFADDPQFAPTRLRNKLQLISVLDKAIDMLELPPRSLLAVDPIALFFGNLNDYHTCAVACLEIRRLCTAKQITLIGLAHASKQKADKHDRYERLQDRINGSSAQLGYGDTQMYLASPQETGQKHYTFMWHPHTAPAEEFPLGRDAEGMFVPWATSIAAQQENEVYAAIPADQSIIPLATIIGLCTGISHATIFRRLKELTTEGLIEKAAEGQYRRAQVN